MESLFYCEYFTYERFYGLSWRYLLLKKYSLFKARLRTGLRIATINCSPRMHGTKVFPFQTKYCCRRGSPKTRSKFDGRRSTQKLDPEVISHSEIITRNPLLVNRDKDQCTTLHGAQLRHWLQMNGNRKVKREMGSDTSKAGSSGWVLWTSSVLQSQSLSVLSLSNLSNCSELLAVSSASVHVHLLDLSIYWFIIATDYYCILMFLNNWLFIAKWIIKQFATRHS